MNKDLSYARRFLGMCHHILVITGAGVSAESGIPTFRGEGERWRDHYVRELATLSAFEQDPRLIWDWYLHRRQVVAGAEPNPAHRALAQWAADKPGITLVTQNVDDLHERAGHHNVLHLHGSLWRNRCTACEMEREERSLAYPELPRSPCCRAPERPAILWFGERMSESIGRRALEAAWEAEAVLTIGTSGEVATARQLIYFAKGRSAEVFDVNPQMSNVDAHARLIGIAGEVIPALVAA